MRTRVAFAAGVALSVGAVLASACGDDEGNGAGGGEVTPVADAASTDDATSSFDGTTDGGPEKPTRWSIVVDPMGRVFVSGGALFVIGTRRSIAPQEVRIEKRSLVDGAFIPSFGVGGVVTEPVNPEVYGLAAHVDATGIYLVVDPSSISTARMQRRSLTDGTITWETDTKRTDPGVEGLATDDGYVYDAFLGLLDKHSKTDGARDPSFNDGGPVTWPAPQFSRLNGLLYTPSVLVMYGQIGTPANSIPWRRYEAARSPVTGAELWALQHPDSTTAASGAAIHQNDVFFGYGLASWTIHKRSLATGDLVPSFAAAGVLLADPPEASSSPSVHVQGSRLYVVSIVSSVADGKVCVVRAFDAISGQPVTTFGASGSLKIHPTAASSNASCAIRTDDVSLYVTGFEPPSGPGVDVPMWIERRDLQTGAL